MKKNSLAKTGDGINPLDVRRSIQQQLLDNSKLFWQNLSQLKPRDFCEVYLKILPYGFSKVPDERPIGEDERQRLILEETTRKATLIGGGLPQPEEDIE